MRPCQNVQLPLIIHTDGQLFLVSVKGEDAVSLDLLGLNGSHSRIHPPSPPSSQSYMPAPAYKTQAPVPLNYLYCDSPATYASAVWILRNAPYLILDCEGNNLGRAGGCVTLICVGTPFAEHIFLFDLLSTIITPRDVYSLLQLLADPGLLKVVWDGRMDYLEILSSYGIMLEGVLDLQVVEVASRTSVRGEGELDRLERLRRSYLSHSSVKRVEQCRDLHAVIGLQRCWTDCGYAREVGKDRKYRTRHPPSNRADYIG